MKKLSHSELQEKQAGKISTPRLPFCAVLNNIRSLYNVGAIFRTADAAGLEKLWLCGITGIPPSGMISKTALGAEKVQPWEYRESALECLRVLKSEGYRIVLLEQTERSIPYYEYRPAAARVCLVAGNEITGVSDSLLALCDDAIDIPMSGLKLSLNVTVAFGIAAYHIRRTLQ